MRFAFSTNAFTRFSAEEAIAQIAELGYEGVELMLDAPHLFPRDATRQKIADIRATVATRPHISPHRVVPALKWFGYRITKRLEYSMGLRRRFISLTLFCCLVLCGATSVAGDATGDLKDAPVNKWLKLPCKAEVGYSWSVPVYVPARGQVLHWGAVGYYPGPGRNDVRAFDVAQGDWVSDYGSTAKDVGITGGGAGSAITYTGRGEIRADGVPKPAMVVFGAAYDSKRGQVVYAMPGLMAAYDPKAKKWTDLKARTVIYGAESAGAPMVYGVGTCYDPVNDEIVMFPHFHAKNTDMRDASGRITGHYGTLRYSFADNTWRRVSDTFGSVEVKKARKAVIDLVAKVSKATDGAWTLRRTGDVIRPQEVVQGFADAVKESERMLGRAGEARAERDWLLGGAAEMFAGVSVPLKQAADAAAAGKWDEALAAGGHALWALDRTLDNPLRVEPPPRCAAPMVYDAKNQVIVMFGGHNGLVRTDLESEQARWKFSLALNDTWVYECRTRQWRELACKTRPPRQRLPMMVYDPASGQVVLVTLSRGAKSASATIWSLDVAKGEWQKRDEQEWPGPVVWHGHTGGSTPDQVMALDEAAKLLVVVQPEGPRHEQVTCVLRLDLGPLPSSVAPADEAAPPISPQEVAPEDPAWVAKLKGLAANTWVYPKPPRETPTRDWGNIAVDRVRGWVVYFGGGHSTYQVSDVAVYSVGANCWSHTAGTHNDFIPIVGWEGSTMGFWGNARAGHMRNQYVAFDGRLYRRVGTLQEAFAELTTSWFYDIDRGGVWREMPIGKIEKSPADAPDTHRNTQMADPGGRVVDIHQVPASYYDWRIVKCYFRSYDINENRLTVREVAAPFPMRVGESRPFCFLAGRNQVFWCEYNWNEKTKEGFKRTWVYDVKENKFIDLKPRRELPGPPCVVEYVEPQKAVLAIIGDQHWVYSFEKNDWAVLEAKTEGRKVSFQRPYGQTVYVARYGVLVNYHPYGGVSVMRPDVSLVKWE